MRGRGSGMWKCLEGRERGDPTFVDFLLHLGGFLKLELRVPVADLPPPRDLTRGLLLQL